VPGGQRAKRLWGCALDRGEAFRLFEEGDDFLQFFFCFVDASNVIKLDPVLASIWKRARDLPKFKA